MRIALGPIPYFWGRDMVSEFYAGIEREPVDIVYIGETLCSKRRELRFADWRDIADRLSSAGKEVVWSTLALIEAESELATLRRLVENSPCTIEANDMAAVNMLAGRAPFVVGPHINLYNAESLAFVAALGARRWVPPVELDRHTIVELHARRPRGMQTEVFAFGRLPLACSARCFTARAHNLPKDECGFRCREDVDGLLLATQEQQPFLVLNGIQIQSAMTYNLLPCLDEIAASGVDVLRLSPQSSGMHEIITCFRAAVDAAVKGDTVTVDPSHWAPSGICNGYWYGGPGMGWQDGA